MLKLPAKRAFVPTFRTPRTLPEAKKQIDELAQQLNLMMDERDQFAVLATPIVVFAEMISEHAESYADDAISDHAMDPHAHKE